MEKLPPFSRWKNTLSKKPAEACDKLVKAITNTNIPVNLTVRRLEEKICRHASEGSAASRAIFLGAGSDSILANPSAASVQKISDASYNAILLYIYPFLSHYIC
jgi:hypothetical protein